jgi:superfamily II DNA or RNA helicase
LYISFRKTFTQALAKRFEDLGNILQYTDKRGDIYFNEGETKYRVIVIQIESLNRFKDTSCDLLVVDEWESVLSQMNSVQGVNVVDCFKR